MSGVYFAFSDFITRSLDHLDIGLSRMFKLGRMTTGIAVTALDQ